MGVGAFSLSGEELELKASCLRFFEGENSLEGLIDEEIPFATRFLAGVLRRSPGWKAEVEVEVDFEVRLGEKREAGGVGMRRGRERLVTHDQRKFEIGI